MESWLMFGIIAYLCYSVSTSLDKYMMNHHYGVIRTDMFKMFFDGLFVLIAGLLFFDLTFSFGLLAWGMTLGFLFALAGITYYGALEIDDVEEVLPYLQAGRILLVFFGGILIFGEKVAIQNIFGVVLTVLGIYTIISNDGLHLPKIKKSTVLILIGIVIGTIYYLLIKKVVAQYSPIDIVIAVYFCTTFILFLFQVTLRRHPIGSLHEFHPSVILASCFGATGTLLLYTAFSLGSASKIIPLAGIQAIGVFIIATFFLKEKFYWHRLLGIIGVCIGIYLVSFG